MSLRFLEGVNWGIIAGNLVLRLGMSGLAPKWVSLASNETDPGLCQNALKSDMKKSRINPIWGQYDLFYVLNLIYYETMANLNYISYIL